MHVRKCEAGVLYAEGIGNRRSNLESVSTQGVARLALPTPHSLLNDEYCVKLFRKERH